MKEDIYSYIQVREKQTSQKHHCISKGDQIKENESYCKV